MHNTECKYTSVNYVHVIMYFNVVNKCLKSLLEEFALENPKYLYNINYLTDKNI